MRTRRIVLKPQMTKQLANHRLGKTSQPNGSEIRLKRPSLLRLSPEIMEIRPELLKEAEAVMAISGHLDAPGTAILAGLFARLTAPTTKILCPNHSKHPYTNTTSVFYGKML